MGIGGGIITRKLLFAVLLVSSLSLAGMASASATDVGNAQTQTCNNSSVQEKVNTQINNTENVNESATTQNSVDNDVKTVENTDNATVDTNQTTVKTQTAAQNTTTATVTSTSSTNQNTENVQNTTNTTQNTVNATSDSAQKPEAAAGEAKNTSTNQTVTPASFTTSQINDAAARVKAYIETNHRLPNYVTIGTNQVVMSDFLKMLTTGLLQINNGTTTPITLKTVNVPVKPSESITSGDINKAGYLDLANRVNAFINANDALPNYANSSLGKLNYESLIYMFSKILNFENTNNRLPSYVTVKPWSTIGTSSTSTANTTSTTTAVPADLQQYLQATANCQVNNPQIQALAKSITAGSTSTLDKATKIFNWVRDKIGYSFYYNTKYGAVGVLSSKTANCVDTAHLLIALERAAGIPARYEHVYAQFSSGTWYGHVIAQVWVNGKWYYADATSSRNTFGVVNNWNTATATVYGTYASLPF